MSASVNVGKVVALVFAGLAGLLAAACSAPVDTSKAYSRSVIQSGGIVQEDELRVAEYLNYYEQKFPEPLDTAVGLDVRAGNWQAPFGESDVWVQIGLQAKSAKPEEIAPLNLALVIDCSGSMADADKMPFVKQSLRVFVQSLAANDRVALVCYDDEVKMVTVSREVGDGRWIDGAIKQCWPGSSTNLHAGLMAGLEEVARHYDAARNNAVIILSDGIANVGVTDPAEIGAAARSYTERGIHLSTIGLGSDFNDTLLSELAKQGQGRLPLHRFGRGDGQGLPPGCAGAHGEDRHRHVAHPHARGRVQLLEVTGQQAALPAGPVTIPMRDMGVGDSQVLLARLRMTGRPGESARFPLLTELRYTDAKTGQPELLSVRSQVVVFEPRVIRSSRGPGSAAERDDPALGRGPEGNRPAVQGAAVRRRLHAGRTDWSMTCAGLLRSRERNRC